MMRIIKRSSAFKKDYKRIKKDTRYRKNLDALILLIVSHLLLDKELLPKNCDHALGGKWEGYRECHIKPDLLLIYKKVHPNILQFARLGKHSELFG